MAEHTCCNVAHDTCVGKAFYCRDGCWYCEAHDPLQSARKSRAAARAALEKRALGVVAEIEADQAHVYLPAPYAETIADIAAKWRALEGEDEPR